MNLKKILLGILLIFLILLSSCKKEEIKDIDILKDFSDTIVFSEELNSDLDLKDTYIYKDYEISALWQSSNENVLDNSGKYYYTLNDEIITLSVAFSYKDENISKSYDLISYANVDKAYEQVYLALNLPKETDTNINLISQIKVGKSTYRISYKSNNLDIIKDNGEIVLNDEDKNASMDVTITSSKLTKTFTHNLKVLKIDQEKVVEKLKEIGTSLKLNEVIKEDIDLPNKLIYKDFELDLTWISSNTNVLSNTGKVYLEDREENISLTVSTVCNISYTFSLVSATMDNEIALAKAIEDVYIPSLITSDIILPSTFTYNTVGVWQSSNENIITNTGTISKSNNTFKDVTLKLTLSKGENTMEKDFKVSVSNQAHFYQDRTFLGAKENVVVQGDKLVLEQDKLKGTYTSNEINVANFKSIVGSYAATSSKTATCELEVRIKSGSTWSKYFSYGEWGLGKKNYCLAQSDTYVKMVEDEILMIDPAKGNAFQFRLTLKRKSANEESPIVSLIAFAIEYVSYSYPVDISTLPKVVKYDVPKLYQHIVPGIGGIICSATSSTMLLKYKGHDFSSKADYEHEYIAEMVLDSGNNIYGNWVYNTIAMSAFGEITYVKRFYSANEMLYHIAKVGPIAASIRGNTITNLKTYNTAGHLLVVTGYKIEGNNTTIYINDPNVMGVAVEMTLENFLKVYRMVSYIIE